MTRNFLIRKTADVNFWWHILSINTNIYQKGFEISGNYDKYRKVREYSDCSSTLLSDFFGQPKKGIR